MDLPENPHSLDNIFGRSTDEKGHSERIQVRVPPDIGRLCSVIVGTGKLEYETVSDLVRDAIWHRLADIVPNIDNHEGATLFAKVNAMRDVLRSQKSNEDFMQIVNTLGSSLLMLDSREERTKLVGKILKQAESITEVYWRNKCVKILKERYGEYFTPGSQDPL